MNNVRELYPSKQKSFAPNQLVTIADLEEFKTDLLLSIKHLLSEHKPQSGKKWLKSYEVKELLEISEGTIQTLRNNGTLPFTKIGRIIYYDREDIEKLLSEMKRHFLPGLIPKRKN